MCGIYSILNLKNYDIIPKSTVLTSFKQGKKRGPESEKFNDSYMESTQLILGFHRLSIVGINPASDQPITVEDVTLICNGEIYNYKQLAQELNIDMTTDSDCEIIIHLFIKFGIEYTLSILDGVFSFVLFDNRSATKNVYIARDPFGVRSLFYLSNTSEVGNIFAVASEMKSLIGLISTEFNTQNHSILQFPPASFSHFSNKDDKWVETICHQKYTMCNFISKHESYGNITALESEMLFESSIESISLSLHHAVRKRVISSDRPIACLLSGGLDSSIVTALVKKYYAGQLETYSIGLAGSEDLRCAKIVADFLNTKHTEIVVTENEMFAMIPETIREIESYDTTTVRASVGNYMVSKYIKEHSDAKVIFNGDGADELMGGYLYFQCAPDQHEFNKECKRLLGDIHYFDVLRSDKSISANGLEPRTPLLDTQFVQDYLNIPLMIRIAQVNHNKFFRREYIEFYINQTRPEKYILRTIAHKEQLLPPEITWRRKEAFSDGVSGTNKSWAEIIQEKLLTNEMYATQDALPTVGWLHNCPNTMEQQYYRGIFETYYPNMGETIPYFWMPKFVEATDSSARTLSIY
jgi:asparagine synthase (glutamine-hydrolysing)